MKLLLALLFPLIAHADIGKFDTVGIHTLTRHDPSYGANDINLGGYAVTDKGFVVGGYYNSYRRMAYYAGWTTPEWYRMKVSFVGVTGYFVPVTAIAIPSLKLWQEKDWSLWISGSPVRLSEDGQSVLHLSIAWSL